ncbi:hypothetical protein AK812_SmicGene33880 [Symbiodinium microadriaticum]|uniref:Uncharacterized protein n=1 Tax=Symbiodinium microadriaticum TaxID=2951 RepID=A0A1Q9CQJ6_SYMMI|nr:hypothetical protein AK812_SmicGene33880 [Symbiodinium microadriaticum]
MPPKVDKGQAKLVFPQGGQDGDEANASELPKWQRGLSLSKREAPSPGDPPQEEESSSDTPQPGAALKRGQRVPPPPPKKPRHEEKPRPEGEVEVKEELQKEERRNKPPKRPKRSKSKPGAGSSGDRPPPPPPPPPADPESSSEEESEEEEAAGDPIVLQEGPGAVGPQADQCGRPAGGPEWNCGTISATRAIFEVPPGAPRWTLATRLSLSENPLVGMTIPVYYTMSEKVVLLKDHVEHYQLDELWCQYAIILILALATKLHMSDLTGLPTTAPESASRTAP